MQSVMGSEQQKSQDTAPTGPRALWPVDLKITHLDWNPEATLIHFQGQYLTICELDYNILQGEIQNTPKARAAVDIGEFCLVEDLTSARWYRGRVQNQNKDLFDVFLIDHGTVLSVDDAHISSCSNELFILPPKIVCGFLSSVLLLPGCCHSVVEKYFSNLIGRNVTGYIQALLPHKVLLLEAPDINSDLVCHGFGRHIDTDTFLLLVEMLTEAPLKQNIEPAPDLLIEKQRRQELVFKPTSLQGYEDILSFCGPRLKCGTRATVRVTAAVNPGLFFCQMANKEADLKELSCKLSAMTELKARANQQKTPDNLGLLCSVKGKDEKWYRGFVQHLPVNSLVRVLFVDYGYFESVKVENIHRLPPDFYSTHIMAFPCALSCVNDKDESVKTQQLSFLKAGLLGGVLEVEINKFKEEQHLYHITILNAKDVVAPTPAEDTTKSKVGSSETGSEYSLPQSGYFFYENIMSEELDKTLEDEEVQEGSVFVGYVEHVQNPNHFWIRTEKRNKEFEEMMEKLSAHFSNVQLDENVLENPEPGTLCCALYEEDMHYYRGVVIDTLEHGAEVLFIDFGNIEKVPHMLIKKIPEELAEKSAFALCCSLVNIVPLDDVWTNSASDFFKRLMSNKTLQFHAVQMRKNKFVVDVYKMESDKKSDQSISEFLISSCQAMYSKNISEQLVGQTKKQNPQTKKNATNKHKSTNHKSRSSVKPSQHPNKENYTPKAKTKASYALKALNIKPGSEFAVCCSLINSPSDFWCHRLDKIPDLETLMAKLQQHYSTNTVPLEPETSCCVARSPHNGKWYRAMITERENGRANVMAVDYGFCLQVKDDYIQGLLPEYTDLEGQAFRCSLYNLIEPPGLTWSLNASELLKRFVCDSRNSIRCKIISLLKVKNKGLYNVVDLCNSESQNMSNLLLEQGLAQKVSTKLSPAVVPESFVYSSYDLNVGDEEQVFVTHIRSHFEVFCQLEKNVAIIEDIDAKISDEVEKIEQVSAGSVVKNLCLAKYFDGKWYRGTVHSAQSPSHLCVAFVDYGNTMIAEKSHVIFISKESVDLLYTPMQALKFSLMSVPHDQVFADVKDWLDTAVLNKQVRAVLHGKTNDGSFEVELFDGEVSINDKLKELIHSLTPKPKIAVTFNTSGKKTTQYVKGRYQAKGKTSPSSKTQKKTNDQNKQKAYTSSENKQTGSTQSNTKPNKKNKTEKIKSSSPPKPLSPPKPSDVKKKMDVTAKTKQTRVFQISSLPTKRLTEGSKIKCFTSHINSLSSFFLQLSDDEADILKLVEDLNSSTFRDTLTTCPEILINIGDLVLAEYSEDGALYRAVVKKHAGFTSFKLEFVDFGNSGVMGKEKMYLITKDYVSQPRYSIPCSLVNLRAFESSAAFSDAVMDKPLMVEFVRHNGSQWEVSVEIVDAKPSVPLETPAQNQPDQPVQQVTNHAPVQTKPKGKKSHHGKVPKKKKQESKIAAAVMKHLADVFMPLKIISRDTEIGLVLSVQSNGDFYVRLGKTADKLASLEAMITVNLKTSEPVSENDLKEGLKCLVQREKDGQWHRAVVQEVSHDTCLVHLLDHGKIETIPKGSLRQMMTNLTIVPPFAVQCRLNFLGFSEEHSQTCYEVVKPIVGEEVKLVFVSFSEKDQLWLVEVVMNGLFLLHHITTPKKQSENAITASETEPEPVHGPAQKLAFAPVELNKEYYGFAAAVTTPFEFCVVLEDLEIMSQVSILLDDLQDETPTLPKVHLTPGTGCLVKSNSKNKWCRVEIVNTDSAVTLNLVDYGHEEFLPYKDHTKLKKLPESMVKLPKVTYPCLLKGVMPVGTNGQWSDEAAVFFQLCLDQKNLQIFFREAVSDCQWKVDVLADGVHVAKQLVDAGHASYTDVMLGLRFQEQSPPQRQISEEDCDEDNEGSDEVSSPAFEEGEEQIFSDESDSNLCSLM